MSIIFHHYAHWQAGPWKSKSILCSTSIIYLKFMGHNCTSIKQMNCVPATCKRWGPRFDLYFAIFMWKSILFIFLTGTTALYRCVLPFQIVFLPPSYAGDSDESPCPLGQWWPTHISKWRDISLGRRNCLNVHYNPSSGVNIVVALKGSWNILPNEK